MNFHAVKEKNLDFFRRDGISKCFFFLHKFEQRVSYIARACVEKYTVLEKDSYIVICCRYVLSEYTFKMSRDSPPCGTQNYV